MHPLIKMACEGVAALIFVAGVIAFAEGVRVVIGG